ncbi:MAG: hypothetical protein M3Z16_12365 [Pseudomonadota bacterium]|nr:hypothetical protein [Pseudomonadota bacterium]
MSKDLFSAVLTFAVLLGGSAAIGSELLRAPAPAMVAAEQTLPAVVVTGKRAAPTAVALQHVVAEPTQIR